VRSRGPGELSSFYFAVHPACRNHLVDRKRNLAKPSTPSILQDPSWIQFNITLITVTSVDPLLTKRRLTEPFGTLTASSPLPWYCSSCRTTSVDKRLHSAVRLFAIVWKIGIATNRDKRLRYSLTDPRWPAELIHGARGYPSCDRLRRPGRECDLGSPVQENCAPGSAPRNRVAAGLDFVLRPGRKDFLLVEKVYSRSTFIGRAEAPRFHPQELARSLLDPKETCLVAENLFLRKQLAAYVERIANLAGYLTRTDSHFSFFPGALQS
jgi:hypothetical protein